MELCSAPTTALTLGREIILEKSGTELHILALAPSRRSPSFLVEQSSLQFSTAAVCLDKAPGQSRPEPNGYGLQGFVQRTIPNPDARDYGCMILQSFLVLTSISSPLSFLSHSVLKIFHFSSSSALFALQPLECPITKAQVHLNVLLKVPLN
jgi:hypothetical protein